MKDKTLDLINSEIKNHKTNMNYRIEGRLEFCDNYIDITDMFNTPELLKEANINKRRVIAINESGYTQLLGIGFKQHEIIKEYEH